MMSVYLSQLLSLLGGKAVSAPPLLENAKEFTGDVVTPSVGLSCSLDKQ
jgi:hypothetical protein